MKKTSQAMASICTFEEMAQRDIFVNKLNPGIKLMVLFTYVILVTSLDKYDISKAIAFILCPVIAMTFSDISFHGMGKKLLVPAIFGMMVGLFNPIFDNNIFYITEKVYISAGWISMMTLFIKSMLVVSGVFIMMATTKIQDLSSVLIKIKVPKFLVIQLMIMMRYIMIFINTFDKMMTSYQLRSGGETKIHIGLWGKIMGQMFLKSIKSAYDLHDAMVLRGYTIETYAYKTFRVDKKDILFFIMSLLLMMGLFIL